MNAAERPCTTADGTTGVAIPAAAPAPPLLPVPPPPPPLLTRREYLGASSRQQKSWRFARSLKALIPLIMTLNVRQDLATDLPAAERESPGEELHRLSRRGFIGSAALSGIVAVLGGCGGSDSTGPGTSTGSSGATFVNNVLTIPLSGFASLAATNGFALFASPINGVSPNVIVINTGNNIFRAFTSVCTHEQCTVGSFDGSRMLCPCHGSQFDTTGRNVAGPAPSPLRSFTASFDAVARVVAVAKG